MTVTFFSSTGSSNSSRMRIATRLAFLAFMFAPLVASAAALEGAGAEARQLPMLTISVAPDPRLTPRPLTAIVLGV